MYTYKTTVIKIALHKIGNIVRKIHKILILICMLSRLYIM